MSVTKHAHNQRYHFSPVPSLAKRYWRCLAPILLLFSLLLWPESLPWPWLVLKLIIAVSLLVGFYRQWALLPCRAFSLADDGQGHWADDGQPFRVTIRSRLLPSLLMLHIEQQDQQMWLWCHRDSYDRAQWHRLCRLVLAIQRAG